MNSSRLLPYLLLLPGVALLLAVLYPFLSGVYWSELKIRAKQRAWARETGSPWIPIFRIVPALTAAITGAPTFAETPQGIRVTRNGGLAEFTIVPAAQSYRIPEALPAEAALTGPLACVFPLDDFGEARAAHREGAGLKIRVQPRGGAS